MHLTSMLIVTLEADLSQRKVSHRKWHGRSAISRKTVPKPGKVVTVV